MDLSVIPGKPCSKYSREDRYNAVMSFWIHGQAERVTRETGIPRTTLRGWMEEEWWEKASAVVRQEIKGMYEVKASRAVEKVLDVVNDRLENGDVRRDAKTGETYRIPVSMRDAAWTGAVWFDKLRVLRNEPTQITETSGALNVLADKIKEIERQQQAKVIEGSG